jgi:hypothetical protein
MIERYFGDKENSAWFTKKAVTSNEYIINQDYVCQLCFKKVKSGIGHAHFTKKKKYEEERLKQQRRESHLRLLERRKLLRSN